MIDNVLLTIVIPTYNRETLLFNTLNNISLLITQDLYDEVQVVISDNASSDNTFYRVQKWIIENKKINCKYSRNESNLGFDRNLMAGSQISDGKFVWFLSDDDTLVEGAIAEVVRSLKEKSDSVFAFVNFSMITPNFPEYYQYNFSSNLQLDADSFMQTTRFAFSFISACIFERNLWNTLDIKDYIGTFWLQLYAAKAIAIHGKSLIIAKHLIKMRREGLQESRDEKKYYIGDVEFFMQAHLNFLDFQDSFRKSQYSKKTYNVAHDVAWSDNLGQILSLKLTSKTYNLKEKIVIFNKMRQYFSLKVSFWLFHVPFLFLPKFFSQAYFTCKLLKIRVKAFLKPYLMPTSKI